MILILGVTASGKGRLAFQLAEAIGAEIISIDSMKVYRRMDIGTAKPPSQALAAVRHHLIDVAEPSEPFSVGAFYDQSLKATEQIKSRNKPIVAVGGTALYIKALLYGLFEGPGADEQIRTKLKQQLRDEGTEKLYRWLEKIDPEAAERIHPNDTKRIIRALEVYELTGRAISSFQQQWNPQAPNEAPSDWTVIGLRRTKDDTSRRINARVKKMISAGLVDEVKSLLAEDKPLSKQARCAIGYSEIIEYLKGENPKVQSLQDAVELIKKHTRRLAKSQRTWFKSFGNINWLDVDADESNEKILEHAKAIIENKTVC